MAARAIAVDWSGSRDPGRQRRTIWLAEANAEGLVRLEGGRTRDEVVEHLVAEAGHDPDLVVGLDFAFSLPAWYLQRQELVPRKLWRSLAQETLTPRMEALGLADWLDEPDAPFWRTARAGAALSRERRLRRTDREVRAPRVSPKSVFQLVGAGQVGSSSLRGMQALDRLADSGFDVWPFTGARLPLVVEIYPRAFAAGVTKSQPQERLAYLRALGVPSELADQVAFSEDAFDAAISALGMAAHLGELSVLEPAPGYEAEGRIWMPSPHWGPPAAELERHFAAGSGTRRLLVAGDLVPPPDYAHAALADGGRIVHTAGAVPLDREGRLVGPGDLAAQTRQTLENLRVALAAAGAEPRDVVKTTVYVVARENDELVRVWDVVRSSDFAGVPSTLLGVSLLGYTGQLVEIEAVAVLD